MQSRGKKLTPSMKHWLAAYQHINNIDSFNREKKPEVLNSNYEGISERLFEVFEEPMTPYIDEIKRFSDNMYNSVLEVSLNNFESKVPNIREKLSIGDYQI